MPTPKPDSNPFAGPGPDGRVSISAKQWFALHPEAQELVEKYVQLRRTGETGWSVRQVREYLVEHFDFPFSRYTLNDYIRQSA